MSNYLGDMMFFDEEWMTFGNNRRNIPMKDDGWGGLTWDPQPEHREKDDSFRAPDGNWYVHYWDTRHRSKFPYSYSPFFIWRDANLKGAGADYSDRLSQYDNAKYKKAWEAVNAHTSMRNWNREQASLFLTEYYGKPTECVALVEGCNVSSGYEYFVLYSRAVKEKKSKNG